MEVLNYLLAKPSYTIYSVIINVSTVFNFILAERTDNINLLMAG